MSIRRRWRVATEGMYADYDTLEAAERWAKVWIDEGREVVTVCITEEVVSVTDGLRTSAA